MSPFRFLRKLSKEGAYGMLLLGLAISLAFGVAGSMEGGPLVRLDRLFLDSCLTFSASGKAAQNTVVVDVDDVSLAAVGQWPWPRYRIAALVRAIAAQKPAVIGLDVIFPEPDQTSLDSIRRAFHHDLGLDLSFVGVPPGLSDNDDYLGHVLAEVGAVGARYFYFDLASQTAAPPPPAFHFTGRTDLLKLKDAPGLLDNTERIASRLAFSGFMNTQSDSDGQERSVPLLIQHRGQIYPHLALATFMRAQGVESATIEESLSGPRIVVGKHVIPIDARAYAIPRLAGAPNLYPAISALDVLNGKLSEQDIKGKSVFIGSSAAALNDFHQTIFDTQFPGLKMLAAITEDLATESFVRQPSWGKAAILAASLIAGMFVSVIFVYYATPLRLGLCTFLAMAIFPLLSLYAILAFNVFVSPMAPLLLTASLFTLFAFVGYGAEKRHAYLWFKKIANARQVTMESMAAVAETRDPETGAHIKRTQHYVKVTAERLRRDNLHAETLTDDYIELLFVSAPLHDIGKVGVPDHILLKPGKLNDDEFTIMKQHPEYGRRIIRSAMQSIEGDNFLYLAAEIAASHHEKWNGTGYPLGLAGEDIPLSGRIMAIADVYDALISRRCYKPPMSHERAIEIIGKERGTHFDPQVLDAFFAEQDAVQAIAAEYRDQQEPATDGEE